MMIMLVRVLLFCAISFNSAANAFTTTSSIIIANNYLDAVTGRRTTTQTTTLLTSKPSTYFSSSSSSVLYYRPLDTDDDPTTKQNLNVRLPKIGYDMKDAMEEPSRQQQQRRKNAMNTSLLKALKLNQLLILVLATIISILVLVVTQGPDSVFNNLNEILDWSKDITGGGGSDGALLLSSSSLGDRIIKGIIGSIPIILLGNKIESSDKREFANVNFSTIAMVMTLFGRRTIPPNSFSARGGPKQIQQQQPPTTSNVDVAIESFTMSALTGLCEELVFRKELPSVLHTVWHTSVIESLVAQALLFGIGHANAGSFLLPENRILIGLQFTNGMLFGLLYMISGGDVVPCIVAHCVYDFITFFKTWVDANNQLEYAEKMYLEPLPSKIQSDVQNALRTQQNTASSSFDAIKRTFFIFDFDKNKILSRSEVRKGVSYLALERAGVPPPQDQVDRLFDYVVQTRDNDGKEGDVINDPNMLSFTDFMRLYSYMFNPQLRSSILTASS